MLTISMCGFEALNRSAQQTHRSRGRSFCIDDEHLRFRLIRRVRFSGATIEPKRSLRASGRPMSDVGVSHSDLFWSFFRRWKGRELAREQVRSKSRCRVDFAGDFMNSLPRIVGVDDFVERRFRI